MFNWTILQSVAFDCLEKEKEKELEISHYDLIGTVTHIDDYTDPTL